MTDRDAGHNLDPIVQAFGSQEAAFSAIQAATQATAEAQGLTGVFETAVPVGGAQVVVRGIVINGVANIGTAFIP